MTTTTIYATEGTTGNFTINSNNATYSTARSTAAVFTDNPAGPTAGQRPTYVCWESGQEFDTSVIPDTDIIDSVVLSLYGQANNSTTDFVVQARLHTWDSTPAIGDWVAGASLSAKTLLAAYATSAGWDPFGYNDFTSEAAFIDNINKTGVTQILFSSDRHAAGTTPTANEYVSYEPPEAAGTTKDPKLVVTHHGLQATVGFINLGL